MPKYAADRTGPRQGLPPASTGYEVAQVVKGPTPNDPYSPAAAGASKANDLLQSLGVAKTIIPAAVAEGKILKDKATKRGAEARFAGDALAPNMSDAFIDGYERMDGEYRGIQFGNAAKDYAATNSHLDPTEFQKGFDELQKKYMGELTYQGQLDTFLPDAIKGGEHAASIYQEAKTAEVMTERNQKTNAIQKGKMDMVLDQAAFDVAGIPFNKGFASVGTDPEMRKKLMDNIDAFRSVVSPQLRQIHDDSRAAYKALGLSPAQIATSFVGTVGRLAGDVGVTSIMDYMYQRDLAGMSPESANPELVNKHADRARAMDSQISTAMLLREEKARKLALENKTGNWLMTLADPKTGPQEAQKIWDEVRDTEGLDADKKEKLANLAADVQLGMGFALKDNQEVARELALKIKSGKVTGDKALSLITEKARSISQATFFSLVTAAKEHKDRESDHSWTLFNHEANTHLSNLQRGLGLTDDLGKEMVNLDPGSQGLLRQVVDNGVDRWFRGLDMLIKKHGGAPFEGAELSKLQDQITSDLKPQAEAIAKNALAGAGRTPKEAPAGGTVTKKASSIVTKANIPKGPIAAPAAGPAHAAAPQPAPTVIPQGFVNSGKTVGGKAVYQSPDGTQSIVVN